MISDPTQSFLSSTTYAQDLLNKEEELQNLPRRSYKNITTGITLNKLAQNEDLIGAIGNFVTLSSISINLSFDFNYYFFNYPSIPNYFPLIF